MVAVKHLHCYVRGGLRHTLLAFATSSERIISSVLDLILFRSMWLQELQAAPHTLGV